MPCTFKQQLLINARMNPYKLTIYTMSVKLCVLRSDYATDYKLGWSGDFNLMILVKIAKPPN